MALFDEIYDNIDASNVGSSNKTGSGKFVLDTSPTIATPTLTTPAISDPTVTGTATFNSGADIKVYSDVATTLKFQVDGATGDVGIPSGRKILLDGASLAGDTYLIESAANVFSLFVGGTERLNISTSNVSSKLNLNVPSGNHLGLDGTTNNTYFQESSAGVPIGIAGGTEYFRGKSTGEILFPAVDPPTANYANRNSIVKAWARIQYNGTVLASYNVSSVSKGGTGNYTINWNTDFSSANYAVVASTDDSSSTGFVATTRTLLAGSCNVHTWDPAGMVVDTDFQVIAIGTQ